MVSQQIRDLTALRDDIAQACSRGRVSIDKAKEWWTVLDYVIGRLELPRCGHCGEAMHYDARLEAYTCDHDDDEGDLAGD